MPDRPGAARLAAGSPTRLTALRLRCGMRGGAKRFALSLWSHEPRNETARLRGGPHRPAKPGLILIGVLIFPDKPPSRQAGNAHFRRRRSFADLRTTPATGLTARRGTHVFLRPDGRRD